MGLRPVCGAEPGWACLGRVTIGPLAVLGRLTLRGSVAAMRGACRGGRSVCPCSPWRVGRTRMERLADWADIPGAVGLILAEMPVPGRAGSPVRSTQVSPAGAMVRRSCVIGPVPAVLSGADSWWRGLGSDSAAT